LVDALLRAESFFRPHFFGALDDARVVRC